MFQRTYFHFKTYIEKMNATFLKSIERMSIDQCLYNIKTSITLIVLQWYFNMHADTCADTDKRQHTNSHAHKESLFHPQMIWLCFDSLVYFCVSCSKPLKDLYGLISALDRFILCNIITYDFNFIKCTALFLNNLSFF